MGTSVWSVDALRGEGILRFTLQDFLDAAGKVVAPEEGHLLAQGSLGFWEKASACHRPPRPRGAIVDYEWAITMPGPLTAAVAVDTFTHGLEAFVSRKANAQTEPIALSCLKLVATHLQAAWNQADDRADREGMMRASFQGGMAFSNGSFCCRDRDFSCKMDAGLQGSIMPRHHFTFHCKAGKVTTDRKGGVRS